MSTAPERHLSPQELATWLAGDLPSAEQAGHLARCPECRRAVAASDPSALFGLLAVLPPAITIPPAPRIDRWPLRQRPAVASSRGRLLLAGVAALLTLATLTTFRGEYQDGRAPAAPRLAADRPAPRRADARRVALPALVEAVYSPTAQIVTVVPPDQDGPAVTLILDGGIDL